MQFIKNNKISFPVYLISILLFSFIIFFDTWKSLVDIWMRSDTYAHGFLVIPGSLWLIWQNKSLHRYIHATKPSTLGISFIILNGLLWLVASITQTLVIQQLALVGMLIGSYWYYLGTPTLAKLIYPTLFLYFMVPVGEAQLMPYLMEFTASFTIALVRLTGLSVYREGLHFTLVSGQWSVVEACSGVRYLISSITLGTVYAYITYSKNYKRTIFIICSIIVPIFANGMRAYMIVMIGHYSDMKLATGVDHIIYGAFFFAIIIFIMFYIGSFWRDPQIKKQDTSVIVDELKNTYSNKQSGIIMLILILSLGIWPLCQYQLKSHYQAQTSFPEWPLLAKNKQWKETPTPSWNWRPKFQGATTESLRYYKNDKSIIGLYQANFGDEQQGAELVNTQHVLIPLKDRDQWRRSNQSTLAIPLQNNEAPITVDITKINGKLIGFTVAKWYKIGSLNTNNPYLAKIYQLYKRLTLDTSPEIYYVVFSKQAIHENDYSPAIQSFINSSFN